MISRRVQVVGATPDDCDSRPRRPFAEASLDLEDQDLRSCPAGCFELQGSPLRRRESRARSVDASSAVASSPAVIEEARDLRPGRLVGHELGGVAGLTDRPANKCELERSRGESSRFPPSSGQPLATRPARTRTCPCSISHAMASLSLDAASPVLRSKLDSASGRPSEKARVRAHPGAGSEAPRVLRRGRCSNSSRASA